jgi:hypothetical protein
MTQRNRRSNSRNWDILKLHQPKLNQFLPEITIGQDPIITQKPQINNLIHQITLQINHHPMYHSLIAITVTYLQNI